MGIRIFTEKDILRIPEDPVYLKPFDPKQKQVAQRYKKKLDRILAPFGLKTYIKGSTALEIEGKGDIDLRIFVPDNKWLIVIKNLINYFRRVETLKEEYVRFIDFYQDMEVEVGLVRGKRAKIENRISTFLKTHPKIIEKYVELKRKYAHSQREYIRQKDKFFQTIWKPILLEK